MPQNSLWKMLFSSDSESRYVNVNNFITKTKLLLAIEKVVFAQSKSEEKVSVSFIFINNI